MVVAFFGCESWAVVGDVPCFLDIVVIDLLLRCMVVVGMYYNVRDLESLLDLDEGCYAQIVVIVQRSAAVERALVRLKVYPQSNKTAPY